jgi:hypothetical protein
MPQTLDRLEFEQFNQMADQRLQLLSADIAGHPSRIRFVYNKCAGLTLRKIDPFGIRTLYS